MTIDNPIAWPEMANIPVMVTSVEESLDEQFPESPGAIRLKYEHDTYCQYSEFISPIPLTPEWLERLGFKPREDEGIDKMVLSLDSIKGGNNEIIAIREYNSKLYWAALISNGYWASNNVTNVHSLQNLFFALTGEEL